MPNTIDQMGRAVTVPRAPKHIISLVPSQTELLFDLGLQAEIVGVTKFCIHPTALVARKQSVGGTKKFRFDVIEQLQPDLIIGNKEENYEEGILRLAKAYPVWLSDVRTLPDALAMVRAVGKLVDRESRAGRLADEIEQRFADLRPLAWSCRAAYFIWNKPKMVVGGDTFINDMLARCGFVNAFAKGNGRYPTVSDRELEQARLDVILLSSEPFPFGDSHVAALRKQFPGAQVVLVDGELFSWYGSRLLRSVDYFNALLRSLTAGLPPG